MRKSSAPGPLFSIDAVRGRDLAPAAKRLFHTKPGQGGGFSTWDASSIFFEMHGFEVETHVSARTLVLLYAADLHFRLRWQILPALEEGHTVVAAPYVETGMAFGLALGLPRRWITEVFRFAPKPAASFWVGGTPQAKASATSGFLEFSGHLVSKEVLEKFSAYFEALERRGKCRPFRL